MYYWLDRTFTVASRGEKAPLHHAQETQVKKPSKQESTQ
jgi:hypothetical protein